MDEKIREVLFELHALLKENEEWDYASQVREALTGPEDKLKKFLVSNELWGGAGSIADQALIETREKRTRVEKVLAKLGKLQMKLGLINERTSMWTSAFRMW
jgi:hypothetical protein